MGPSESDSSSLFPWPPPSGMTATLGSPTSPLLLRGSSSRCRGGLGGRSFRSSSSMSKSSSSGLWRNTAVSGLKMIRLWLVYPNFWIRSILLLVRTKICTYYLSGIDHIDQVLCRSLSKVQLCSEITETKREQLWTVLFWLIQQYCPLAGRL